MSRTTTIQLFADTKVLTMDRFIACACHGNLQQLVIKGKPTIEQLTEHWIKIKSQHLEVVKDGEAAHHIDEMAEYAEFELRHEAVNALIAILWYSGYDEEVCNAINELDFDNEFTPENYLKECEKIDGALKTEQAFWDIQRKEAEGKQPTPDQMEQSYYLTIKKLQKHFGELPNDTARQAAKKITVWEFGCMLNEYNNDIKAKNRVKEPVNEVEDD